MMTILLKDETAHRLQLWWSSMCIFLSSPTRRWVYQRTSRSRNSVAEK